MSGIMKRIRLNNRNFIAVALTQKGRTKEENQDSFEVFDDGSQIVLAVCDGLGSAPKSGTGSSVAAKCVTEVISSGTEISQIYVKTFELWKERIGCDLNDYDTTCKFIHITDGAVKFGGVGDGWIAVRTSDGYHENVSDNIFSNQTDSLLSFDLKNAFRVTELEPAELETALISTDGFSEDIHKENGMPFLVEAAASMKEDPETFMKEMASNLENWPVETNLDDKTVIFIQRVS